MNRTLIILLGLLIALSAPCQSKKERKKNKIRSTTEWETGTADGQSATFKVSYEEFDKGGRSILKVEYAPEGTVIYRSTAAYNSNGNKTEETEFDPDKKKNLRWTYKYNALNDRTEELEYESTGAIRKKTAYGYDARGNRITETETDGAGNLLKKLVFTYNSKNLKTGKTNVTESKQKERSKKWDYVFY